MKRIQASLLLLALNSVAAWSQRDVRNLEAIEKPDPPAWPRNVQFSPASVIWFNGYTSFQVNVNAVGNNIVGDAANEPSLVVDPTNPDRMAVGWRQFNSVTSNFRQAGWAYTINGGLSWTFPGVLENNVFRSDPVLDTDADGKFYYLSLLQSFFDDLFSSANQGATWTKIGAATGGDKQWMIVDRTNGIGRGNIYQIWSTAGNNYGGRQFSRTTNGGVSWMNPINIPLQPVWGVLDVTPTGDLYICGSDGGSEFYFVRSTNAKNAAVTPTFDLSRTLSLGGSVGFSQSINPAGLSGQCYLVTDKSSTPMAGNIYMLSSVEVDATNPCDVKFVRSSDGGSTWSSPKRLNDDPSGATKYHWMAAMAISPGGRIDVVWNDTRDATGNQTSALYWTCSFDGGDTWLPNVQVSPSFNQSLGYPNQNKMGDYLGLVSDDGGARVAYCATFNSEEDVYYLRIPTPEAVSPFSIATVTGLPLVGGVADVRYSENVYAQWMRQWNLNRATPPIQFEFRGLTSILHPSKLRFKLEAHANTTGLTQRVALFNYVTSQYETVSTVAATTSDSIVTVDAAGNLDRFVDQGSGEVKAFVWYTETPSVPLKAWTASVDQMQWVVLQ